MSHKYYHTKESVDSYIKMAEGYNGQALIERLKKHLKNGCSILELGSGPGNDIELLGQDFKVTGSDYSELFLERLNKCHTDISFLNLDAISLSTTLSFDGIYSNKVLQHLTDKELKTSIENQYRIVNDDGVICHSFWNGEGCDTIGGIIHNYHTRDDLVELFSPKFTILHLEEYKEMDEGDSLFIIAQKVINS